MQQKQGSRGQFTALGRRALSNAAWSTWVAPNSTQLQTGIKSVGANRILAPDGQFSVGGNKEIIVTNAISDIFENMRTESAYIARSAVGADEVLTRVPTLDCTAMESRHTAPKQQFQRHRAGSI